MLNKLIKLDLRFAYRQFLAMAALLLFMGLIIPYMNGINIFQFGMAVFFAVAFTSIPIISIWLVVQHFKRNLYSDEGYLMFSLPVNAPQLLFAKIISTLLWFNFMLVAAALFVLLAIRGQVPLARLMEELANWELTKQIIKEALKILALLNANVLPLILAIFMGLSLATVAVRNKKLGHIWATIATIISLAFYGWLTSNLGGYQYLNLVSNNEWTVSISLMASEWINVGISLAFSLFFFLATTFIMSRKLNLD